ncbi:MAG: hypothetical protein H3C51_04030 [Rubellimicrobium sp.]|nr:hypothetical protein [Rubellimicrobium sp.]
MLRLFDVVWVFDLTTAPQKRKMFVCLSFDDGWYLRINTKPVPKPSVPVTKARNPFLDHDSHVECALLEVDDYEIAEAIRRGGVVGRLSLWHRQAIAEGIRRAPYIRQRDKDRIAALLG